MQAIVYEDSNPPSVLKCEEIEPPIPGPNEVLLRVHAAAVNPLDWRLLKSPPFLRRIMFKVGKAKIFRPGVDASGVVEAVGSQVTQFRPGDAVFGSCHGAFAEYACARQNALAAKPEGITFEQAAAAPVAALTALQGLRDKGRLQAGQQVLINGAAGGVGTFAVQIAKSWGAQVTAVCSTRNVEMVRNLGADRVIDYTQADFAKEGRRYDVIFDCYANHSLSQYRRLLNPTGIYVGVGGPVGSLLGLAGHLIAAFALSHVIKKKFVTFLTKAKPDDLAIISALMTSGKVQAVIDRAYTLAEVQEAVRYLQEGHARGKVVITVAQPQQVRGAARA